MYVCAFVFRFGVLRNVQVLLHVALCKNHYSKGTGHTHKSLAGLLFKCQDWFKTFSGNYYVVECDIYYNCHLQLLISLTISNLKSIQNKKSRVFPGPFNLIAQNKTEVLIPEEQADNFYHR